MAVPHPQSALVQFIPFFGTGGEGWGWGWGGGVVVMLNC